MTNPTPPATAPDQAPSEFPQGHTLDFVFRELRKLNAKPPTPPVTCARCGKSTRPDDVHTCTQKPVSVPEMTVENAVRYLRHFCDPDLIGGSYEEDRDAIVTLLTAFERQQSVVEAAMAWHDAPSHVRDPQYARAAGQLCRAVEQYRSTATEER